MTYPDPDLMRVILRFRQLRTHTDLRPSCEYPARCRLVASFGRTSLVRHCMQGEHGHGYDHHEGPHPDSHQGLGNRAADRRSSRMAVVGGRPGRTDDVLSAAWLPSYQPRPPWAWAIKPDVCRQRDGHLRSRCRRAYRGAEPARRYPRRPLHGGGEVARYVAQHGRGRVAKAVLIRAVTPIMLKSDSNPGSPPMNVFDELRAGTAFNRSQSYQDVTLPFYGYNRPGARIQRACGRTGGGRE